MNADVIMPICAANTGTLNLSIVAMRTCRFTTSANILLLANNTPDLNMRRLLQLNAEALGCRWVYVDGEFSMSRFWNMGADMTSGEFIAYANADSIFYPDWYQNLVNLWRREPHYFLLTPYSFDVRNYPVERRNTNPEARIVATHNPAAAVQVFQRASRWRWDEQFTLWEMDADVTLFLERNKLRAGVAYNSRVDHLCSGFVHQIDFGSHFGPRGDFSRATTAFRTKWNVKG